MVLAFVLLGRSYEAQRAVFVLCVVGGDEVVGPRLRFFEAGEAIGRIGRMILADRSREE